MNDRGKDPFDMLLDSIRLIVREEIAAAIGNGRHDEPDQLLTPQEPPPSSTCPLLNDHTRGG